MAKAQNKGGRPRKEEVERRESEKAFREGLIAQLAARKADTPFFVELVDEIMYQRERLRELKKIIHDDGIVVSEKTRGGALRVSMNLCLREIRETEKAILTILKELKVTTDNVISDDADDEL